VQFGNFKSDLLFHLLLHAISVLSRHGHLIVEGRDQTVPFVNEMSLLGLFADNFITLTHLEDADV